MNEEEELTDKKKKFKIKKVEVIKYKGLHFYNLLRSIIFLIFLVLVVLFFVLNAEYKTSIYLIYRVFKNVSASTIMLVSFLAGYILCFLVTVRQIRIRQKKLREIQKKQEQREQEQIDHLTK